ncbi:MAG: DNA-directed RNA polymerase subunit omega [bacterium]|jgi:DNA-directed RNA polymerase subunit omega|nr:DNA-directed RNA polymerase subunit omega [Bacillota bacterium]HHW54188.1 DNA-directed RNA polymerase subunit omega [Bacillota bacterium]
MIEPSFDALLERVDSKYTLVVAAAKRARQLLKDGSLPEEEGKTPKPVTVALQEIAEGKLSYRRKKSGIK